MDLTWADPLNNLSKTIGIYRDQKLEDRNANRIIRKLWGPTEGAIILAEKWPTNAKLNNNRRRLWIHVNDEPYQLFQVNVGRADTFTILPDYDALAKYGIRKAAADSIAAGARLHFTMH